MKSTGMKFGAVEIRPAAASMCGPVSSFMVTVGAGAACGVLTLAVAGPFCAAGAALAYGAYCVS
jgi:hypothetical protein